MTLSARLPVCVGVDVGSTNSKVVALTGDGAVVARASRPTRRALGIEFMQDLELHG